MSRKIDKLEKFAISLSKWLDWIGAAGLVAMFALATADIIGIKALKHPIPGAIEIVAFLGVVVTAFAMAYTQVVRGHISVEIFTMRLSKRVQAGLAAFVSFLGIALFIVLAWRSYDYGRVLQTTGEVSMTQRIPFYPFVYGIVLCSVAVALLLVVEFLRAVIKVVKD